MSIETLSPVSHPEFEHSLSDMELGSFTVTGQVELIAGPDDMQRFEDRATELRRPPHNSPEKVAQEFDLSTEQAEAAINNGEAMLPNLRVAMRMPRQAFETLLAGEPYKTAYELGFSRGGGPHMDSRDYLLNRARQEKEMGFRSVAEDDTIIYGYLTDESEYRSTARAYGQISVTLKPDTINRSTFTRGDSLRPWKEAPELLGPEEAAIAHEALEIKRYTHNANNPYTDSYVEAQILGGVTADDVEAVVVDMGFDHFGSKFSEAQETGWPDENAIEQLIEQVEGSGRNIALTIRIPAVDGLSSDVIELAKKHPGTKFVAMLSVDQYNRHAKLPYQASFYADLFDETSRGEAEAEAVIKDSKVAYEQAKRRQAELRANLVEFWESQGHTASEFPQNIQVIVTGEQ